MGAIDVARAAVAAPAGAVRTAPPADDRRPGAPGRVPGALGSPITISGTSTTLRLVEVADARFVVDLRRSPRGRYLSPIAADLGAQEAWIRSYKVREARREEYYFIVNHRTAGDVGTLRMHDLDQGSFWWGSWIVSERAPVRTALESMFLVYELGFFGMGLERALFVVRKDNPSLSFHAKVGARIVREDGVRAFFELSRDRYRSVRARLARKFAPGQAALGSVAVGQD